MPDTRAARTGRVSGTHVILYELSEQIEFTLTGTFGPTDQAAAPDLIIKDMKKEGNGREDKRVFGSKGARYEVDWSLRSFIEIMFMARSCRSNCDGCHLSHT